MITGGAGFIGSALIRELINNSEHSVLNVDKLTYAGNLDSLKSVNSSKSYQFSITDICDEAQMKEVIFDYKPDAIMNLAAESHVDRSIDSPYEFIHTNIIGTYTLLDVTLNFWKTLNKYDKENFRFHHISTDEVYGSLGESGAFSELHPYQPNSPYSSSKASSDHLVRAWNKTYDLPTLITNCSNNYGPYQFPEKLIPLVILNALSGKSLPIYGDGKQIRDWLFVDDHVSALLEVLFKGKSGETYNIGGNNEITNIELVRNICSLLDKLAPESLNNLTTYSELITYVDDRPGHDRRYAIDSTKIKKDLKWEPVETSATGLEKTIVWYLENQEWVSRVIDGSYMGERLGLGYD